MFYGLHISLESRGEDSGPVEQRHVSQEASRVEADRNSASVSVSAPKVGKWRLSA